MSDTVKSILPLPLDEYYVSNLTVQGILRVASIDSLKPYLDKRNKEEKILSFAESESTTSKYQLLHAYALIRDDKNEGSHGIELFMRLDQRKIQNERRVKTTPKGKAAGIMRAFTECSTSSDLIIRVELAFPASFRELVVLPVKFSPPKESTVDYQQVGVKLAVRDSESEGEPKYFHSISVNKRGAFAHLINFRYQGKLKPDWFLELIKYSHSLASRMVEKNV